MAEKKVALVTGASSGIGRAAALELGRRGFAVYGGARRVGRMADLRAQGVRPLALDVTDDASAREAVAAVAREAGRLDVLVNNAGYGSYGAVEDVPLEEGRRQFDVNVFGAVRLTRAVLPLMRERGSGRIVNVTSVGGRVHTPLGAWYHGTKFALEGMSDVLRLELRRFGVDVVVVRPGGTRTEWGGIAAEHLLATSGDGVYGAQARRLAAGMMTGSAAERVPEPAVVARAIAAAATARRPRTRYAAGYMARRILLLRGLLPDRAFDRLVDRALAGA
ncbi:Short-chain dehydrogenase [Nocardiopsis flavescens]|uniref:Short-chain dehydrogenase n=1 Tax=Nocardiopsis flavescens TaxID=758803 RepID=A0A1M6L0L4_9ACTN|nr:oxidoreductase [Nocardiopsis flavescens]SHJ64750.1 Short-chain dehydrogenase [Nocardiopsis flavescens]